MQNNVLKCIVGILLCTDVLGVTITSSELWELEKNSINPVAVLFHDENENIQWWEQIHSNATLCTFPVDKFSGLLELKIHEVKHTPAVKFYKGRTHNIVHLNDKIGQDDVATWIDIHLQNVSTLTKKFLPFYANGNAAVVIAQTQETCAILKNNTRNPHVAYACYFGEELVPGCNVALFGKYMNAACVKNASNIYPDLQRNVYPMLLTSQMMNDPLLFQLHPFKQTVFVISDTPPHVSNVSNDIHVIWERTNSGMFGVQKPTVIRQDTWMWYGLQLHTDEAVHNAVYDVLRTKQALNMPRMFMAMASKNFSLYFDSEWDSLKSLIPERPPVPTFTFKKPKLPPLPNLTLDIEKDKEMARRMGIDIDAQNNKTEL